MKPLKQDYKDIKTENFQKVEKHRHNGLDAERIKPENLQNAFLKIVDSEPTEAPTRFIDQIQLYSSGDNSILYAWDNKNKAWLKFNYYIAP